MASSKFAMTLNLPWLEILWWQIHLQKTQAHMYVCVGLTANLLWPDCSRHTEG